MKTYPRLRPDLLHRRTGHHRPPKTAQPESGLTRLDVVTGFGAVALLATVTYSALGSHGAGSERAVCGNNLRQIGRAVQEFAGARDGLPPWWTYEDEGGSRPRSGNRFANAWFEFAAFTNQISPRVLTCPADLTSDPTVRTAADWNELIYSNRQASVSYTIGVHAGRYDFEKPSVLSTDRNLQFDPGTSTCAAGYGAVNGVNPGSPNLKWTNSVHGNSGHALLFDGSTEFTSSSRVNALLFPADREASDSFQHIIRAR